MTTFLVLVMLLLCVFMVMVVLVQRGRGGGLSGAFGSGGGSSSAFGTKTGDVFTTITVVLFVVFMLISIWLSFRYKNASMPVVATAPAVSAPMAAPPVPERNVATTATSLPAAGAASMPVAPVAPATSRP